MWIDTNMHKHIFHWEYILIYYVLFNQHAYTIWQTELLPSNITLRLLTASSCSLKAAGSLWSLTYWRHQHPPHQTVDPKAAFKIRTLLLHINTTRTNKQTWVVLSRWYFATYNNRDCRHRIQRTFAFTSALAPIRSSATGTWPLAAAMMRAVNPWNNQSVCAFSKSSIFLRAHSIPASLV